MSSTVSPRPLSLTPFFAVDGLLLLTALFIAWRTTGDLAGGALLGVIVCIGLGAVLTVLPFVLNDAREREAALAERQRELVDLVNSSTATASRWGTQWTAAATGLGDASGLASRSIAAAELLPTVLQEKMDAFALLLAEAERSAKVRELAAQSREEHAAAQAVAFATRAEQTGASVKELERTLAGFVGLETSLREQHAALAATLAEFPLAVARAQSAQTELNDCLAAAPAQIATRVEADIVRITSEAEARLSSTTEALTARCAELDTALSALVARVARAQAPDVVEPAPVLLDQAVSGPAATPLRHPDPAPAPQASTDALSLQNVIPVQAVFPTAFIEAEPQKPAHNAPIMDPFYIPIDGYSALADAMDAG